MWKPMFQKESWIQDLLFLHNGGSINRINFRFKHAENAFKSNDEVWSNIGFFQALEEKSKQVVDQSNHKKILSEKSLD